MLASTFEVQRAKAEGTVYIRPDGTVDPPSAPIHRDGDLYTFTDNINGSVVVERNSIVVDGTGHALKGDGAGIGIDLSGRNNVTVKNIEITTFYHGIYLNFSFNNTVLDNSITASKDYAIAFDYFNGCSNNNIVSNNITNNGAGIDVSPASSRNNVSDNCITANNGAGIGLYASKHNILYGNNITANNGFGIFLSGASSNNTLRNNSMAGNEYNFGVTAWRYEFYLNDIDVSNTVDGKPIFYWINKRDMAVPLDVGFVALLNCSNITVKNLNLTNNGEGLLLALTENCTLTQNNIAKNWEGITLDYSSNNNNISYNNIVNNGDGICLYSSSNNNSMRYNTITNNSIWFSHASDNFICYNNMISSGILLDVSSNTVIYHNNMSGAGIWLDGTSNTIVSYNNIANGGDGIGLECSSNNAVSHNRISANEYHGFYLSESSNNNLSYNDVIGSLVGFELSYSSDNNIITNNNIADNRYSIWLFYGCSNNAVYHNNFINNTSSVDTFISGTNVWDNGYPSGGNYWSNCNGVDLYRGLYQNETGSDGIADAPQIIDASSTDHYPLMKPYAGPHDIGIKVSISKTVIPENYNRTVTINVKIINYGEQAETFNFTFQINTTIQEQTLMLTSRNSTNVIFNWNATGWAKGNYTLCVYGSPVPGETDIKDNTYAEWLVVTILGDIDGDGKVDMKDIGYLARRFAIGPADPLWNPNADINDDLKIDMKDIGTACRHYGETWQ
jgi:parallel beta-helix repeat protein